jgi:hypothetical protein
LTVGGASRGSRPSRCGSPATSTAARRRADRRSRARRHEEGGRPEDRFSAPTPATLPVDNDYEVGLVTGSQPLLPMRPMPGKGR